MHKRIGLWFLAAVILMSSGIAFAATEDENRELGIEMRRGVTLEEATAKAQGKIDKYNHAKQEIADSFHSFNPKQMITDLVEWIKKSIREIFEWVKNKMPSK